MTWLKQAGKTALTVLAAVAAVLLAARAYKQGQRATSAENKALQLAGSRITDDLKRVDKFNKQADKHAKKAKAARKGADTFMDTAAQGTPVMSDVVDSWNSRSGVQ